MEWHQVSSIRPREGVKVLIWRKKSSRYAVATMINRAGRDSWSNEYSNAHWIEDDDWWTNFEPVPEIE